MRAEDIELLATPTSVALHGDLALVALSTPDLDGNTYTGGLHRVGLDGGGTRQWTNGHRDTAPAVSPDGRWVAFLRADAAPGTHPQLHVLPVDGGESRTVTDLPHGAGEPVWAPDSRRIAFCARQPEPGRHGRAADGEDDAPEPTAEAPRRITRLFYRLDGVGYVDDQPVQLFVLDALAESPKARALTTGLGDPDGPVWTPDGERIVVTARRGWGAPDLDTLFTDLYAVPADGGEPVLLAEFEGSAGRPVVLPDSTVVFFGEHTPLDERGRPQGEACNTGVWSVAPGGEPVRLTDEESVDCERGAGAPVPVAGGVLVGVRNRGAVELRVVALDGRCRTLSELPVLAGEQAAVLAFAADADRVLAVVSTPDSAGDVVLLDDGESRVLTDFSADLRAAGLRQPVEVKAAAPDGYPTHGWLVLPEGDGPHPVLLVVHGGPYVQYSWGLFDEAQVYASAGYAVVLANPRGAAGYGQAHGRAILGGALGTVDVDDLLSVLDAALERPDCDAARVGVMGGSYGGWMTGWLAAKHGDRFVAAWSERAVHSWDSFLGTSDIGWFFTEGYCGYDPAARHALSPLTYAADIRIPFAVVHSEQDWRCPVEQAHRMYVALKRAGADTEMLLFPGEGHELTRSGQPRHRAQRFAAVLDWWGRHLPV